MIGAVKDSTEREAVEGGVLASVIDTSEEDLAAAVLAGTGGERRRCRPRHGWAVLFDSQIACLGSGGRMTVMTAPPQADVSFDIGRFYRLSQRLLGNSTPAWSETFNAGLLSRLHLGFESGALKPPQCSRLSRLRMRRVVTPCPNKYRRVAS